MWFMGFVFGIAANSGCGVNFAGFYRNISYKKTLNKRFYKLPALQKLKKAI